MMKALGMTRRQVRAIVLWQASTILVISAVLGLVLGWAAGHLVWSAYTSSLGVPAVTALPLAVVLLGLLILVVAGDALSALPAELAARAQRIAAAQRVADRLPGPRQPTVSKGYDSAV